MNIKSLILGSAAVVAAVSGARAADAVVFAEPEAMEYVRVCDVYGAGFYYIPGTETCLKIGGYVRYQINASDFDDGFRKYARAVLGIDARSETELGTLRSFIELRGEYQRSGPGVAAIDGTTLRQAFIELGGFKIGLATTINDDALSAEFDSGGYDSRVHMAGYTWDGGNGFTATINLEEYESNYDFTPNVIGRIGVTQGWGGVRAYAAYDATYEEFFGKLVGSVNLAEKLELEALATYESGSTVYSVFTDSYSGGFKWSAGANLRYGFSDKGAIGFGGQYFADAHDFVRVGSGVTTASLVGGEDDWVVGTTIDYKIVKDFNMKVAANYWGGDLSKAANLITNGDDDGYFQGFVRFQRNF